MTLIPYDENDLTHNEPAVAVSEWQQYNSWFSWEE